MTEYRKELVSPDGDKYVSTSPTETNDLVYGSGYREADTSTAGDAAGDGSPGKSADAEVSPYAYGGELTP